MTNPDKIYKPNLDNGKKLYDEARKTNARCFDYSAGIDKGIKVDDKYNDYYNITKRTLIIPYTWEDFTDLVAYERSINTSPDYSAMMAVNLMKSKLKKCNFHYSDLSLNDKTQDELCFYNDIWIIAKKTIPTWDYTTGTFFDKFFETRKFDAVRQTLSSSNTIDGEIKKMALKEKKKNPNKNISNCGAVPLKNENDNKTSGELEDKTADSIELKMTNSFYANENLNLSSYQSPETIFIKDNDNKTRQLIFGQMNNLVNFKISKDIANVFAFLNNFMEGDFLKNSVSATTISNIVKPLFESVSIIFNDDKTNKPDNYEEENDEDYDEDYDEDEDEDEDYDNDEENDNNLDNEIDEIENEYGFNLI